MNIKIFSILSVIVTIYLLKFIYFIKTDFKKNAVFYLDSVLSFFAIYLMSIAGFINISSFIPKGRLNIMSAFSTIFLTGFYIMKYILFLNSEKFKEKRKIKIIFLIVAAVMEIGIYIFIINFLLTFNLSGLENF